MEHKHLNKVYTFVFNNHIHHVKNNIKIKQSTTRYMTTRYMTQD